jgi:hypothetical protein
MSSVRRNRHALLDVTVGWGVRFRNRQVGLPLVPAPDDPLLPESTVAVANVRSSG